MRSRPVYKRVVQSMASGLHGAAGAFAVRPAELGSASATERVLTRVQQTVANRALETVWI